MKKLSAIFAGIAALLFAGGCGTAPTELPADATLLDVRSAAEYQQRSLPGSILIPHDQITEKAPQQFPDKSTALAVFCRSGRRSAIAKAALNKLGYTNVTDLGSIDHAAEVLNLTIKEN